MIKRREFITFFGGAAVTWPFAAQAQPSAMPVVGFVSSRSLGGSAYLVDAFRKGLAESGYVEGQNLTIEFRWAQGQYDRLPTLIGELIAPRNIAVLVAVGGEHSALAAKAATATIPIVFSVGGDPVKIGLAESLNRPGGNATGVSILTVAAEAKRLGMLHELVPNAALVGVLTNRNAASVTIQTQELEEAARAIHQRIQIAQAATDDELSTAFATLVQQRTDALLVAADPSFDTRRDRIIAFAAQARLSAIYPLREYTMAGGLMSYGISITEGYRQVGIYTAQILKGAKPTDLPIQQSTKFEFVINLKTAKALGAKFSDNLLSLADEVIE